MGTAPGRILIIVTGIVVIVVAARLVPSPGEWTPAGRAHRDNSPSTRPPRGFGGAGLAGGSVILLSVNFFHPSPTGSTGHGEHREQAG